MTVQQPSEMPKNASLATKLTAGAISSVPVVGGIVGAWFQHYVEEPFAARAEDWRLDITELVNELAAKYEDLPNNQVLLDALVNATRAAQATHQQDKITALKNGVLNSVAPEAPDVDEQARFFRLIDELTPSHIVVLRFLKSPGEALRQLPLGRRPPRISQHAEHVNMGRVFEVVEPRIAADTEWRDLLVYDLKPKQRTVAQRYRPRGEVRRRQLMAQPAQMMPRRSQGYLQATDEI
jgi:hypothetical protein